MKTPSSLCSCLISEADFFQSHSLKQIFPITVSPYPKGNWLKTHIMPVGSSWKIVPPWKQGCDTSWTYLIGKQPVVTINWSSETKYPTSYFPMIELIIFLKWHISWLRQDLAIWKPEHFGTGKFGVGLNLGNMTGGLTVLTPSFYVFLLSLITYLIWYILVPSFQYQSRSSFFGTDKLSFS